MAEWWVDPESGLTTNAGTSADFPWKLIPGQTGASSQTGYTVAAGDTINVRNGTRTTLQVIPPANNLTYRGYGLASNVLRMRLPAGLSWAEVPTVRQAGTHEGMWIVDADGATTFGMLSVGNTRNGVVIEDCHVVAPLSDTPVSLGMSGSSAIGVTLRRCMISGAAATGISAYTRQVLLEDVRVDDCQDDAITLGASATNGYRAGYADVLRRLTIINPGVDNATFLGDAIQVFPASDRYESPLTMEDIYIYKDNNTKQGIVLADMLGGFSLRRFYFDGPPSATVQLMVSGLRGRGFIGHGVFAGGCASHAAIRVGSQSGVSMATGSRLVVESTLVTAPRNNGLFNWAAAESASTVNGSVLIHGCYVGGVNQQGLSYSGAISAHPGAAISFGGNQSLIARNNVIEETGEPAFRIPAGAGGSALYKFENNVVAPGVTFAIGSTAYADLAAFEAAHADGDNIQDDPLLDASYRPMAGSPCIGAGVYVPGAKYFNGVDIGQNPDIGARRYVAHRTGVAVSRTGVASSRVGLASQRGRVTVSR